MDHRVLLDDSYRVPAVPDGAVGIAWLRTHVARFHEGRRHRHLRGLAEALLADIDPASLRRPGDPVATLATALGLPRSVVPDVELVAAEYHPHIPATATGDDAVERLVAACGGRDDVTAARIGLLVQSCGATRAMVAGTQPPVPVTRRVAPDGRVVEVDLAGAPFGAGAHACPGRDHALALVDGATAFHRLHDGPGPLVLPNAWDLSSAAAFVDAGFPAVGTTSLGVAASHGLADGRGLTRQQTLDLAERLVQLPVPVTVDIESGFGGPVGQLGRTLADLGVAGVNIEDGRDRGLADATLQSRSIAELKEAAPQLFVNARVDTHWIGAERDRTLDRARRYVDAGADGIFVPGLVDEREIERLVAAVPGPVNLLAQLPVGRLRELGVRRVSTGSLPFRAALRAAVDAAVAVRGGTAPPPADSYAAVDGLAERWASPNG